MRRAMKLPDGRWSRESHAKLTRFLDDPRSAGGLALFDADNTVWTGDLGDTTLVHLTRELGLSERVPDLLPHAIDVPAGSFGLDAPGRLFPAARLREAQATLRARSRGRIQDTASGDARPALPGFRPEMIEPDGLLHEDRAFLDAHAAYRGTLFATYALLEASVGCVAWSSEAAPDAVGWFPEDARAFLGEPLPWRAMLDTGPSQLELARAGKLGAYSQIAIWEGLDRSRAELEAIALAAWAKAPPETPSRGAVRIDDAQADAPGPHARVGVATMMEGTELRPEVRDLFEAMLARHIMPIVVTASQVDLVRAVLERHYGLRDPRVAGMRADVKADRYGSSLLAPATYGPGKVDAARELAGGLLGDASRRPVFAAGDTTTDLEMLAYAEGYRLFFDRGKRPFMDLAEHLIGRGHDDRTVVQAPF